MNELKHSKYREFVEKSVFNLDIRKLSHHTLAEIETVSPSVYLITFDKHKIKHLSKSGMRITLLHEIAHAYTDYRYPKAKRPHSKEWKNTYIDFQRIVLGKVIDTKSGSSGEIVYKPRWLQLRERSKKEKEERREEQKAEVEYINSIFIRLLDEYYEKNEDNSNTNFEDFLDYVDAQRERILASAPQNYRRRIDARIRSRGYLYKVYFDML